MKKLRLPKDVPVFRNIREEGYYYADKTAYINQLVQEDNNHIFLSRPRGFGKSLFVSTLKEAFEGNKKLFEGLDLYDSWDWSAEHPVVHLDFSAGNYKNTNTLLDEMKVVFKSIEDSTGLTTEALEPGIRLHELIGKLHKHTGKGVVLLVDEFDKPMLDAIEEPAIAIANQNTLRGMYGVTKRSAENLHFCFFSGVSGYATTSLLSGASDMSDITIEPKYNAICGYTEADLDKTFAPEIDGFDRDEVSSWYGGYSWLGEEKVYNPYDILHLFSKRKYQSWWFKSGMPTFLINTLKNDNVMSLDLDRPLVYGDLLESFDLGNISPKTWLFQTGHLTIIEEIEEEDEDENVFDVTYRLDYPNREVRQNLNLMLLDVLLPGASKTMARERRKLIRNLSSCNVDRLKLQFQSLFACLPKQWHAPVDLTKYEAYFASSLYSYFMGVGLMVRAEEATDKGRIDLVVEGASFVYVIELKMVIGKKRGEAMKKILKMEYQQKYRGSGKRIYLMGIEISRKTHNIVGLDVNEDTGDSQQD